MKAIKKNTLRHFFQLAALVLMNGYAVGFQKGTIFQGKSKMICVPVLNCYSCPGALGACPIGSLQSVLSSRGQKFSFYVLGTMMLFGILLGRISCGFLCPFGLLQDALYKIPVKKLSVPKKADRILRYLKYLVLVVLVIGMPLLVRNEFGFGTTYFCQYVCPAGTLQAGFPLIAANPSMRDSLGGLFIWKTVVLTLITILSVVDYRAFCKYLCPLGAFYALFNRFSFAQLEIDQEKCTDCGACEKTCLMGVEIRKNINAAECIRCGKCQDVCPEKAIHWKSLRENRRHT